MVSFIVYDLIFLVVFTLFVIWFMYSHRQNLKREGIMYLYRTKFGIRAINYIGDKCKGFFHVIKYFVISIGFILMTLMIYLFGTTVYQYVAIPEVSRAISAPPIAPLIPYFPQLYGLTSVFPPFYFTYFLVALAIVAIFHEFSHGVFMRAFKTKIKSTGIVFLGPILGAFVEEDPRSLKSKKKSDQMAILAAGTFMNLLLAILFLIIYILFFILAFAPSGYIFNTYASEVVNVSEIENFDRYGNLTQVSIGEKIYFGPSGIENLIENATNPQVILYQDVPAVRVELKGVIVMMNNLKIKNVEDLQEFLKTTEPGDKVNITTIVDGDERIYSLELAEHPSGFSYGYLGIGHVGSEPRGFIQKTFAKILNFKDPSTYYTPKWDGNLIVFFQNLFFWIALINFLVALFNMLPLGILDGGRFFYLFIMSLTRSERVAKFAYRMFGYLILLAFIVLMVVWFLARF